MRTVLAALASLFVLVPVCAAEEGEPPARCGKSHITVDVLDGNHVQPGPVVFRRADLQAIYAKGKPTATDPECVRAAREKAGYESAEQWLDAGKSLSEFMSLDDHCEVLNPDRQFTLYVNAGKLPLFLTITQEAFQDIRDCLD